MNVSTERWGFRIEQSHMVCRPPGAPERGWEIAHGQQVLAADGASQARERRRVG